MAPNTKVSGLETPKLEMAEEYKYGLTGLGMKVIGSTIKQMAEADWSMLMVMCTRANGRMIKHMEKESTPIPMDPGTKVIGEKISSMDLVLRNGLMVLVIREIMLKVKNMEKENLFGQMGVLSTETFMTIILRAVEFMSGLMAEYSMENGKTIKCKDMELSHGLTAENMLDNIMMIWNKEKALLNGLMAKNTSAIGVKVNSMEREYIFQLKEKKSMANGS
jgi:hypothetical protein